MHYEWIENQEEYWRLLGSDKCKYSWLKLSFEHKIVELLPVFIYNLISRTLHWPDSLLI